MNLTVRERYIVDPILLFHLFIFDEIIDQVVFHTNAEIDLKKEL